MQTGPGELNGRFCVVCRKVNPLRIGVCRLSKCHCFKMAQGKIESRFKKKHEIKDCHKKEKERKNQKIKDLVRTFVLTVFLVVLNRTILNKLWKFFR